MSKTSSSAELSKLWEHYGIEEFSDNLETLFPKYDISLDVMLGQVMDGDLLGALGSFGEQLLKQMAGELSGLKNILIWLLIMGMVSAMLTFLTEILDSKQVGEFGFYVVYLLFMTVLLQCFDQTAQTAVRTVEHIILFIRLLIPAYLLAVGLAFGTVTVTAYHQLLLLLIYGVEGILATILFPVISCYCMLAAVNGIWVDGKLALFLELLDKGIKGTLKAMIGIVTGVSAFQAMIAPAVDSMKKTALQKVLAVIPGIGSAAEGVTGVVTATAFVMKNSLGVVLLILLLLLCAVPLLKIWSMACLLKLAAAMVGLTGDKRLTACITQVGESSMLMFRTTGTAMLLFLITISIAAMGSRGI